MLTIAAEALLVHVRQRGADQQERRLDHQRQQQPELLGRELLDRVRALDSGVVDQDVDVEFEVLQRRDVEQVDRPRPSADLVGHRLRALGVDVGHGHVRRRGRRVRARTPRRYRSRRR